MLCSFNKWAYIVTSIRSKLRKELWCDRKLQCDQMVLFFFLGYLPVSFKKVKWQVIIHYDGICMTLSVKMTDGKKEQPLLQGIVAFLSETDLRKSLC